ncbi:hypothetical protein [Mucilaginibacter sp.]|uniref:hypothetical protein n=1 Tax=Mucilaginibacter sp. TaxID=1882438 RepID=UPI002628B426|nr:hypothetical protein [Mucilaginibacter sp.]MDB5130024.1 hypothetical protein [Mucilaginibacter sp.]
MRKYLIATITFFVIAFTCSCTFLANSKKFGDTSKLFIENLLHKDYDKCIDLLAFDPAKPLNRDSVKAGLDVFRNILIKGFGDKLEYSFIRSEKTYSTLKGTGTPPNTTLVFVQYSNKTEFGILQGLFDDKTGKILDIKTLDIKGKIPNMLPFWLFGLVAICIPAFNIYMIVKVKRSDMRTKWLKYLFIVILNIPAIGYNAVNGLFIKYLNLQMLLGFSFNISDYFDSFWIFGIPLGGLIILLKLKSGNYRSANNDVPPSEELIPEINPE